MSLERASEQELQAEHLTGNSYREARKYDEQDMTGQTIRDSRLKKGQRVLIVLLLAGALGGVYVEVGLFGQLVDTVQSNSFVVFEGIMGHGWWRWWK